MEDIILNNQVPNNPVGVPDDQFNFQTISELEVPPNLAEFDKSLDPEYEAMLEQQSALINKFAMAATHNYNSPYPAPSTGGYNTASQQSAPNPHTLQGKLRLFSDVDKQDPVVKEQGMFGSNVVKIADPVVSGIRQSNFDRFYASPAYGKLGWHPHANMEEYYNERTTWWDDTSRMLGELGALTGTGFLSGYRSWGSDGVMDLQSAVEYEDAIRIGSSSKDGFGAGFNNFLLNSGYTFGIIGSIALEEAALFGLAAIQGGLNPASDAILAARTASNASRLAKLGRRVANSFSVGKLAQGTRAIVQNLKRIENARDFYSVAKAGGNVLGKMLIPETMSTFKNLK